MRQNGDQARSLVIAEISRQGISQRKVAEEAGIDIGTLGDFLSGTRWPRPATLEKIERYFRWKAGTLENTARGLPVEPTPPDVSAGGVLLDVSDSAFDGLTADEREEVILATKVALLQKAREIRQSRA